MLILITERTQLGKELAAALASKGIYSFLCPHENGLTYCHKKDTGGVLIDCTFNRHTCEQLCRDLRECYPELPIAVLAKETDPVDLPADRIFRDIAPDRLLNDVLDFCYTNCGWSQKPLQTYYLSLGNGPEETYYMGYPLSLSPRAWQILRCLLYRAPRVTSAADLFELCYPMGGSASNVAVQIHRINAAAKKLFPLPLIVNLYGKGYKIRDGIL